MPERHKKLGSLKDALDEITAAGDTARLQLHLLLMNVRERRGDLSAGLETLERDLDRGIEQAVQAATTKTRAFTKNLRDLLKNGGGASQGMSVQSLMTPQVRACSPQDPLYRAAQIMWDLDCGVAPVVDGAGKLCGVITDRDICMAAYTKGLPLGAIRVEEAMSRQVYSCRPGDTLDRAASLMAEHQVRRVPVTDAEGHPVGMLALSDLVNAQGLSLDDVQRLVFQLLRAISKRRRSAASSGQRQAAA